VPIPTMPAFIAASPPFATEDQTGRTGPVPAGIADPRPHLRAWTGSDVRTSPAALDLSPAGMVIQARWAA
jgi:hypothetical protein